MSLRFSVYWFYFYCINVTDRLCDKLIYQNMARNDWFFEEKLATDFKIKKIVFQKKIGEHKTIITLQLN